MSPPPPTGENTTATAGAGASDWRSDVKHVGRTMIKIYILEKLKNVFLGRFHGLPPASGLSAWAGGVARFEESVYTSATSQSEYLTTITKRLQSIIVQNPPIPRVVVPDLHPDVDPDYVDPSLVGMADPPSAAAAAAATATDWRAEMPPESREMIKRNVFERLKTLSFQHYRWIPNAFGLSVWKGDIDMFEGSVYNAATSQLEYFRMITRRVLTLEAAHPPSPRNREMKRSSYDDEMIIVKYDDPTQVLLQQPCRTAFHFQPPQNWMNDPNDGTPAILYTGVDSQSREVQNLAIAKNPSDPYLREWIKSHHNPLMVPVDGIGTRFFRDPTTAWQGPDGKWRVIIGSEINGHGTALLYQSDDFVTWSKSPKPLHFSDATKIWECPDFYPVSVNGTNGLDTSVMDTNTKHVLKASINMDDYMRDSYVIGTYEPETDEFVVDVHFKDKSVDLRYDYGVFYASKTFYDSLKGRRVMWGWVLEADNKLDDINKGWAGLQSFPRSMLLDEGGKQLTQWPIREIESLRTEEVNIQNKEIEGGAEFEITGITASQADVEVSFHIPNLDDAELLLREWRDPEALCRIKNASAGGNIGPFGLMVLASDNLAEHTDIFFRIYKGNDKHVVLMCSDQSRSSLREEVEKPTHGAFVDIDPSQKLSLRTLIDHSIIESFGGGGKTCITARAYPKVAVVPIPRIDEPILVDYDQLQPYRTGYHFQPPKNWMNGPMYYNGVYHLFYQYNPQGATWAGGFLSWGHSVSYNLVDWIHLEPALDPTDAFDINGCWSGSATILPDGTPVILYTGSDSEKRQVQNLAFPKNASDPYLSEWGPDGKWRVIIGCELSGYGAAVLYLSEDLVNWTKSHRPFYSTKRAKWWECADFFPVNVNGNNGLDTYVIDGNIKHILKASFNNSDYYVIGTYEPEIDQFVADDGIEDFLDDNVDLRYDYGMFYDSNVEAILLDEGGKQLLQWPVREIETLRTKKISIQNYEVKGGAAFEKTGVTASQADIEVSFHLPNLDDTELLHPEWRDPQVLCSRKNASAGGKVGPFGFMVLASSDLTEHTDIFFRIYNKGNYEYVVLMCSDQTRSSLREGVGKSTFGAFLNVDPTQNISLRSLIDHSIVESFGGGGKSCITARVYPQLAVGNEAHLYVFNYGSESVVISNLSAWSMKSAELLPLDERTKSQV
ncbi:OLC1v1036018C1 [Oldenlandia corymbosa var. corymbosa]|uniref:OLC1v1036018C1 n=1 Tax=Oldenlandia corymbosa var. corymbosa TaxID=529605 RepID=A0AAV1CVF6_OLDCO|nr:OLC1v1036018C1 [Oldenlandia corymbosa var. corymbosa]